MADWKGVPFLRLLLSADRFKDRAILLGSFDLNMPDSRSNASLVCITLRDHFFFGANFFFALFRFGAVLRALAAFFLFLAGVVAIYKFYKNRCNLNTILVGIFYRGDAEAQRSLIIILCVFASLRL